MSADFTLGQSVTVDLTTRLIRRAESLPNGGGQRKWWQSLADQFGARPSWLAPQVVSGIVVGLRTTTDGVTSYGYDEPTTYRSVRGGRAVLVAWDLRRAPVMFRPEDVTR